MTDERSRDEIDAIQIVIDRVAGYQDGASEGTVRNELEKGLSEAGLDLSEDEVDRLASAIEAEHGSIEAATVLGRPTRDGRRS